MRILSNDPSLAGWGWAVTDGDEVLEIGCIKTVSEHELLKISKPMARTLRVSEIAVQLLEVIRRHNVSLIISELPHGSQNASAAISIGITIGILQTLSDSLNIPIQYLSEGDSKKALLGKRHAEKSETLDAIKKLYNVTWSGTKFRDEAVADALSIHNYFKHQNQ
jgi:Holliday junction resolvasome RuvABC endonuclease subunit